jgi:hypothetical protein
VPAEIQSRNLPNTSHNIFRLCQISGLIYVTKRQVNTPPGGLTHEYLRSLLKGDLNSSGYTVKRRRAGCWSRMNLEGCGKAIVA